MIVKTIFSGFGGQGVLMMGFTLAQGAMNAGYQVTFLPAYGAEVRGGTANCTVAVSDDEIASPIASEPDHLVVLNTPSLYTFQNRVASGGTLFLNSSIIAVDPSRHNVRIFKIPASEIAEKLGNLRIVNTVMMGAFLQQTGLIPPDIYLSSMEEVMGSKKNRSLRSITRLLRPVLNTWRRRNNMAVKQISVLLGNVPGTLARLTNILDKEDITAKALLAASAAENSTVRMVVNDPERAAAILESFGFNYELTPVLAAEVPLHPGGMNAILKPLAKAEINIHYLYTTINRIGKETIVILGVDKIDSAREILQENWIHLIEDEIYSL